MRILFLEPFDGGSHAAFARTLQRGIDAEWTPLTLPGRHWKWRMRGSAARFALAEAEALRHRFDLLLASSYLPLAELRGLVPALGAVPAVLYFHENQIAYPTRPAADPERDLHFAFTQLVSCLAADRCVFNSSYNRDSFLAGSRACLDAMPDALPPGWLERIAERSVVLGLPLELPCLPARALVDTPAAERSDGPVVLWNHRWEHDKNPSVFFGALLELAGRAVPFRVIVCGERYRREPHEFAAAREGLGDRILHWGYAASRDDYVSLLRRSHIAVSTARHEFFGVAMLEAAHCGAWPLVPDRLSYPELFPPEHRYDRDADLAATLERLARGWISGQLDLRGDHAAIAAPHAAAVVLPRYEALFAEVTRKPGTEGA